mgnify:CR=1 FL=1
MSTPTIKGANAVTRTSRTREFTRAGGTAWVETWVGPIAKAEYKYAGLIAVLGNNRVRLVTEGGVGVVELQYAAQDTVADVSEQWELLGGRLERPLEAHPDLNKTADQAAVAQAQKAIEEAYADYSPVAGAATTYYKIRRRGTTHFIRSAAVLRSTVMANRKSQLRASWKGVDRAQILYVAPGPRPPSDLLGPIGEMADFTAGKKQWLKIAPVIQPAGPDLYRIVQDFLFAFRWSATLYAGDVESDGSNP